MIKTLSPRSSRLAALALAGLVPTLSLLSGAAHATAVSAGGARGTATLQCRAEGDGYFVDSSGIGFNKSRLYTVPAGETSGSWSEWEDLPYFTKGVYMPAQGGDTVYVEYAYHSDHGWETAGEWAKVIDAAGTVLGDHC